MLEFISGAKELYDTGKMIYKTGKGAVAVAKYAVEWKQHAIADEERRLVKLTKKARRTRIMAIAYALLAVLMTVVASAWWLLSLVLVAGLVWSEREYLRRAAKCRQRLEELRGSTRGATPT